MAASRFAWVQTVERAKIAARLGGRAPVDMTPLSVCIQVNASGEASKSGVTPGEVVGLARVVAGLPG